MSPFWKADCSHLLQKLPVISAECQNQKKALNHYIILVKVPKIESQAEFPRIQIDSNAYVFID